MSEETRYPLLDDETPRPGESFLGRLHRRKTEARLAKTQAVTPPQARQTDQTEAVATPAGEADIEEAPTDADMPPLESLGADSDYTGFLSPRVSETLRRAALRKLFHGAEFNIVDGLDEYAEDFTTFEPLGDIVTADMRHMIELEAKKKAEAIKQALLEEDRAPDVVGDESGGEETTSAPQEDPDTGEETGSVPPPNPQ